MLKVGGSLLHYMRGGHKPVWEHAGRKIHYLHRSRDGQKVLKNEMCGSEFATDWRHREILGRPAARYLAIFVFLSFLCFMPKRSQHDPKVMAK